MQLKLTDIEAGAVVTALENYRKTLEAGSSEDKGVKLELDAVKGLLERIHSLPGAPNA